jgi:hypothetical protein
VFARIVPIQHVLVALPGKILDDIHESPLGSGRFVTDDGPHAIQSGEALFGERKHKSVPARAMPVHHGKGFAHDFLAVFEYVSLGRGRTKILGKSAELFLADATLFGKELTVASGRVQSGKDLKEFNKLGIKRTILFWGPSNRT